MMCTVIRIRGLGSKPVADAAAEVLLPTMSSVCHGHQMAASQRGPGDTPSVDQTVL